MKDVTRLKGKYFDIPTQEIADHIKKWLATLNFELKHGDWDDEDRRLFFPSGGNVYFFTNTEDDRSWRELHAYGLPKYEDSIVKNITEKFTEDNIRDFYFEVNNQNEADDALNILEGAGEVITQRSLAFISDMWCYITYFNGLGWRLNSNPVGKESTYDDLVNLYRGKRVKPMRLHSNVTINGKLSNDKIVYVNELVDKCTNSFQIGNSFLDLIHKKQSKIVTYKYTYYVEQDKLYVVVLNDRNDKTQCIYHKGEWAEIIKEKTIKPNSAVISKNIKDLRYPDVVHIENRKDYDILKSFHLNISDWNDEYFYYLIGQGFSKTRKGYENVMYTIYEMDQIIIDNEQSEIPNMSVFPGIKVGDIVVSLVTIDKHREIGDMFKVLAKSTKGSLYYTDNTGYDVHSTDPSTFRLATNNEVKDYERGLRNINTNLPKPETNADKANKIYPKGTKVKLLAGTDGINEEVIIEDKFITYENGSISYKGLPGYVYCSKTNEWAKVVGVSCISEDLNDVNLKCKISNKTIDTKIVSIPTINKELKQKNKKFYF